MPTKLVPITIVKICTSPNTANAAVSPVSMPAASGNASQNTRALRNTHSSSANVASVPTMLMVRLSASAAVLDAAANSAPPAASVSAPCFCAMARLSLISGSSLSLPEK